MPGGLYSKKFEIKTKRECKRCGEIFPVYPYQYTKKYCDSCSYKVMQENQIKSRKKRKAKKLAKKEKK